MSSAESSSVSRDAFTAQQWSIASPIEGKPTEDNFALSQVTLTPPAEGNFAVLETLTLSVDPYLRGVFRGKGAGFVPQSGVVFTVSSSTIGALKEGVTYVAGLPWQDRHLVVEETAEDGSTVLRAGVATLNAAWLQPVPDVVQPKSLAVGALGMPGQTAYFGLNEVCALKDGDVVFVSGAAGAVGSMVGQLAKLRGCYVIGTAGSEAKLEFLREIGFDAVFNYKGKDAAAVAAALKEALGEHAAIDVYFDNVGGVQTEACWDLLAKNARVGICGQISMYNDTEPPQVAAFLHKLIYKSVTVRGFVVSDFFSAANFQRFFQEVGAAYAQGKIKVRETVLDGIDKVPEAFIGLFEGRNTGKMVVNVRGE